MILKIYGLKLIHINFAFCFLFATALDIDPDMLFRIIEVLNSFNTATQMRIEDYVNFFITLVSKLNVYYGKLQ